MLTCPACGRPLYPHPARRTDDGWTHTRCPCRVTGCERLAIARGYCKRHYKRAAKGATPEEMTMLTDAHLEDLEWMAANGERFDVAAARLHPPMKATTLDRALRRVGRLDLLAALQRRGVAA